MKLRLPKDATPEELELFKYLSTGMDSLVDTSEVYKAITDNLDRFIICYVFEAGYTRRSLERILNMTKSELHTRIKNIKVTIYKSYKNSNLLKKIDRM